MASRFGRKKRAKMRAEIQALHDIGHKLAHENITLADRAIKHAAAYNALAEKVSFWDEEICYWLGEFSALRLTPGTLETKHAPDELHSWRVDPQMTRADVTGPGILPADLVSHVERLFHVLADASRVDLMKYQRLVTMQIRASGAHKPVAEWVYALSEHTIGEAKRLGRPHIEFIAGQVARIFRDRMIKEMGR